MATRTSRVGRTSRARRGDVRSARLAKVGRRGAGAARVSLPSEYERQRLVWLVVNVVLCLALLAGVAAAGSYGYQAYQDHQERQGHQAAATAARQLVVDFLTISAKSVTKDLNQVLEGATGEFKKQYQAGMSDVRTAVIDNKVSAKGQVLRSGVVSGDSDSVTVIVAADVKVKNRRTPKGRKAHYRVQVEMVYVDKQDRWLVSRLDFVG